MKKFFKYTGVSLLSILLILGVIYLFLPKGPRDPMQWDDPQGKSRPAAHGKDFMVVTGTPWATDAAVEVLESGGNACDAAVAALLMINVTYGEAASFPSVAPLLYYDAQAKQIHSYAGVGTAPQAATIEFFKEKGYDSVPRRSILAQLLPASPDAIVALLQRCGTRSFSQLAAPAIKMAKEGFPVHNVMMENLNMGLLTRLGFAVLMPYNAKVYLGGQWWRPLHHANRFRRPDLANTLEGMARAEEDALRQGMSRQAALGILRDYFYKGPIAEKIVDFHEKEDGLITASDLAHYHGKWDEPLRVDFGEYTVLTNPTYTQGIALLLALKILEPDRERLKSMGHNSPEYAHHVLQAIELAMADREAYAGDPDFVDVPTDVLLTSEYAANRRKLFQANAFAETPPAISQEALHKIRGAALSKPGERPPRAVARGRANRTRQRLAKQNPKAVKLASGPVDYEGSKDIISGPAKDTSYISIIDKQGNAISLTPSDFPISPMVPGTGLTLGIRMTQFSLNPDHPGSLAPGKRPRITPHAVMVLKNGKFFMSCGSPGGEMQTQATLQFLLNLIVFEMEPQKAVESFRFRSRNWPDAFSPHEYLPHTIEIEKSLESTVAEALQKKGYEVHVFNDWDKRFGAEGASILMNGEIVGAADPREETWARGK